MWIKLILLIPINAVWALPSIGWLLLCSSFARSKPFLWAFAVPIMVGVIIGWVDLLQSFALPNVWYWKNIASRLLLSTIPGSWLGGESSFGALGNGGEVNIVLGNGDVVGALLSPARLLGVLASPDMWIGAVAGIAMIAAAIYFRRKRTESYA
jgi:ABC-2 type transport system permease protein